MTLSGRAVPPRGRKQFDEKRRAGGIRLITTWAIIGAWEQKRNANTSSEHKLPRRKNKELTLISFAVGYLQGSFGHKTGEVISSKRFSFYQKRDSKIQKKLADFSESETIFDVPPKL